MTTRLDEMVVRTDADLEQMWRLVMGKQGPGLRSLWMVLIDEEGQLQPVIVPIDDLPLQPDSMTAGLAEVLTGIRDLGEPALLLSRPGPGEMTENDRQWGRALAPLTRRAVYLYTPSRLQVFAPDDLVPGRKP